MHAYVLNVREEPLIRQSTTPLLVDLEEVGAREGSHACGIQVVKRLNQLTNWGPQDFGNTFSRGREGAASAKEVRAKLAAHVEQMVGQRPKEPDRIGKMERMIRELDPTSTWRRLPKSSFEGTNSQRKAAADKYV